MSGLHPSRRQFLAGLAGVGAGAILTRELPAQSGGGNARRLDLHHHFGSPRWVKRAAEIGRQGWQQFQDYSPAKVIEAMDKAEVATAFLSNTTPGIWYGTDFSVERHEAIAMARDMNEYAAKSMSDYKGRFGLFTVLPLPDIDASLKEIEYGLDTLKADGVGLMTNFGGIYIGDKRFEPILAELNRRNALVYSHPTDSPCCRNIQPNVGGGTIEWQTDTTRAIASMIQGGQNNPSAATRFPNVRFSWSHAGGTIIGLIGRFFGTVNSWQTLSKTPEPNSSLYHLRRFYYDVALSTNPITLQALKQLVGAEQIVFGSDYPFGGGIVSTVEGLQHCGFTAQELRGIDRENALKILPKYRS
jgi:6-methylsalicylate decarboxylase